MSRTPPEFKALLVNLYAESASAADGSDRKAAIEDAIEKVRALMVVWGQPTPEQVRITELETVLRDLLASGPGTDHAPYEDRSMVAMKVRWGAYKAALAAVGIVR